MAREHRHPKATPLLLLLGAGLGVVALIWIWISPAAGPQPIQPSLAPTGSVAMTPDSSSAVDGGVRPEPGELPTARVALVDVEVEPGQQGDGTGALDLAGERLDVRVLDRDEGGPVVGAVVVQYHAQGDLEYRTDAEGLVQLALLDVPVRVRHPDYVEVFAPRLPDTRPLILELARSARLRGRLVDVASSPVAEVSVRLGGGPFQMSADLAQDVATELVTVSDDQGHFEFRGLLPTEYTLLIAAADASLAPLIEERVQVWADDEREQVFVLEQGAALLGSVVLHRSTTPVPDVRVELSPSWPLWEDCEPPTRSAHTDREGRFEVEGLSRGTWDVVVRAPWGVTLEESVSVPGAGETLERTFAVRPPGQVSGRVYDAQGETVAGARVWITARPDDRDYDWSVGFDGEIDSPFLVAGVASADGEYRFDAVPAREALWILALPAGSAGPDERPGHFEPLRLVEGEVRAGLDLTLEPAMELAGTVTDEEGRPLGGVSVEAWHARWGRSSAGRIATTDGEGRFQVGPLPSGPTRVEFSCDGYRDAVRSAQLVEGVDEVLEQELAPAWRAAGWVVDEAGWGIQGAALTARLSPGSRRVRATTDAFGEFELEGLTEGRWNVRAKASGWRTEDPDGIDIIVPDGAALSFILSSKERQTFGSVHGEIVWKADGRPVWDLGFSGVRGGVARLSGAAFEVHGIRPGRARIVALAPGMEPLEFDPVDIAPGAELDLGRHVVRHATRLTVAVRDPSGAPVRGAKVQLVPLPTADKGWGKSRLRGAFKDPDRRGIYRHEAVPRYAWRLRVAHRGFATHTRRIQVSGARQTVSVVMKAGQR